MFFSSELDCYFDVLVHNIIIIRFKFENHKVKYYIFNTIPNNNETLKSRIWVATSVRSIGKTLHRKTRNYYYYSSL